jgi:hypothetical protein
MTKKAATARAFLVAALALAMTFLVESSFAAGARNNHVVKLAGMQRLLTQKMSKEILLVALGIDAKNSVRELRESHDLFDRTLRGLRDGDVTLGLPETKSPKVLERLSEVEELWAVIDPAFQTSLESGSVSAEHLSLIADLNLPLLNRMNGAVQAYVEEARVGGGFSILAVAVDLAGRQRMLTQKMTKEFMLIAYGHEIEQSSKALSDSMALFDTTLNALIQGSPQMNLLSAPTPEIKAQLKKVRRLWGEFQPLLTKAAEGGKPDPAGISQVATMNMSLLQEMHAAVLLYAAL